jgi:hypothetical protein
VAVLALMLPVVAVPATGRSRRAPTDAQIRRAIRHAQHSRELWATVNICNTPRHRYTLGIRGQMPALGFASRLYMRVQVDYWVQSRRRFVPDPGVAELVSLGSARSGLRQGGVMFQFAPPAILSGTITFEWRLGRRILGRATRLTAHGVRGVDYSDPRGYSAATCRILS